MPDMSDAGDAALIADFQKKLADTRGETPPPEPTEGEFTVGDPVVEPEPKSREERRGERPGLMEALEQERESNRELRERLERLEARSREMPPAPPAPRPTEDPHAERIKKLDDDLKAAQSAYNAEYQAAQGKLPPERLEYHRERMQGFQDDRTRAIAAQAYAKEAKNQPPPPDPHAVALRAQHPDIFADPARELWAKGRRDQLAAEKPPQTMAELHALQREALKDAEAHFKIDQRPPASDADRRRAKGRRQGSDTGGGRKTVRLQDHEKRIALALYQGPGYRGLTDDQKFQKFVNEHKK